MIKNYIIIAFRSFMRALGHVSTNVIGLGIGIALCISAFLLNAYNNEFNKCYDRKTTDQIYRLEYSNIENEKEVFYGSIDLGYTEFLEQDIPGIKAILRTFGRQATIKCGENRFTEFTNFFNQDFIETLPFKLVKGSYAEFSEPDALYLSEEIAIKLFGDEPVIGNSLELVVKDTEGGIQQFKVKGVFEAPMSNSSLSYVNIFSNMENLYRAYQVDPQTTTTGIISPTLVMVNDPSVLKNPSLLAELDEQARLMSDEGKIKFRFTPFSEIHKTDNSQIRNTFMNGDISRGTLITFNLMSLMILLIACFNYTIYAFSFAGKRLKEIGVRKVSGGKRKQIMLQFLSESLILSLISLFIGLLFTQILIPWFDRIFDGFPYTLQDVSITRLSFYLIALSLIMAFVAGFYPAFYVSRFSPSAILAKNAKLKKTGWVTYSLVMFQQVITIVGIGASIIFTDNIYYQENMDYGYDKENLLTIQGLNACEKSDVFIDLVENHPKVISSGISWKMLGNGTGDRKVLLEGAEYYVDLLETGPNYLETNKVRLIEGRFWNNNSLADMKASALVNEKFLEVTKLKEPLNAKVTLPNGQVVSIVGVVHDYKHTGAFRKTEPTVIHYPMEGRFKFLAVRGNSMDELKEIDRFCKEKWESIEPFKPYISFYESFSMEGAYESNISLRKTFLLTAIIALILSVGGMFSMVTMFLQKRTKEIAIRKSIGSSIQNLLYLISKPYLRVSILACIMGSFAGLYLVSALLDDMYDYHVKVKLLWFIVSGLLMVLVTLITISTQTLRAAVANPVKGLRYE